ncbi:AAA family ATPase [Janthinobacterium sp. SUN100]|uniref:AAA family ATPase n=1 Tax=Janthinobacterium sp. SUN100 TaxID=3004101 RepID=UPI0025B25F5E|nr:AAA family ATPase [Janthinobacterium sp. SUN100]MDN2702024.1 AAA family ATPase [Janthinobacterium sp. SUN100]
MIEFIRVRNFKSLGEVSLQLVQFNCLIGMNGAGKSTVLQAFDFLSHLMLGDVQEWLDSRGWLIADLNCKLRTESNITLQVGYRTSTGALLTWVGIFNRTQLRCTSETITIADDKILRADGKSYSFEGKPHQDIAFTYQGSLLSALKDTELPEAVLELRDALRRIRSLELLSPQLLRKSARTSDHDIGAGGEKLSAYLDNIKGERKEALIGLLKRFYPALTDFKVVSQRSGWKKLSVQEQFGNNKLETEAAHLNDGLLRILAVLTQADSNRSMILLDEIENGINQEIVETLVDTLVSSHQQILVTTHSPLILNYLGDDVARQAVQFIYKTPDGESRIRHFFEVPRIGEKLRVMGPGDAFVDTDLSALTQECIALDEAK